MLWGIIVWIVVGGVAGWLAAKVMGREKIGCGASIALGMLGGVVGGLLFQLLGGVGITGINLWSIIVAFLGAVIVLAIVGAITKQA